MNFSRNSIPHRALPRSRWIGSCPIHEKNSRNAIEENPRFLLDGANISRERRQRSIDTVLLSRARVLFRFNDRRHFTLVFPREKSYRRPRSGSRAPRPFPVDLDLHLDLGSAAARLVSLALARSLARAFPLFAVKRAPVSGNELAFTSANRARYDNNHDISPRRKARPISKEEL